MAMYAVFGSLNNNYITVKAGAVLPIKLGRVDISMGGAGGFTVYMYTGGGAITGGSTFTPIPLRSAAPAAGVTSKVGATAISGTANIFTSPTLAAGTAQSWSSPASVVIPAGSSTVIGVLLSGTGVATIYVDELEIIPGF